jgi:hypothetical protein
MNTLVRYILKEVSSTASMPSSTATPPKRKKRRKFFERGPRSYATYHAEEENVTVNDVTYTVTGDVELESVGDAAYGSDTGYGSHIAAIECSLDSVKDEYGNEIDDAAILQAIESEIEETATNCDSLDWS